VYFPIVILMYFESPWLLGVGLAEYENSSDFVMLAIRGSCEAMSLKCMVLMIMGVVAAQKTTK